MQGQKEIGQKDKQWSTKHYTENYKSSNTNQLKPDVNSGTPEGYSVPAPPVALLLLRALWRVMNE